jgi:hypothetical protein
MKTTNNIQGLFFILAAVLILSACQKEEILPYQEIEEDAFTASKKLISPSAYDEFNPSSGWEFPKQNWGAVDIDVVSTDPFVFTVSKKGNELTAWTSTYRLPDYFYLLIKNVQTTNDGGVILTAEVVKKDEFFQDMIIIKYNRKGDIDWNIMLGREGYQFVLASLTDRQGNTFLSAKSMLRDRTEELYMVSVTPKGTIQFASHYLTAYETVNISDLTDLDKQIEVKTSFEKGFVRATFNKEKGDLTDFEHVIIKTPLPQHGIAIKITQRALILEKQSIKENSSLGITMDLNQ